MRFATVSTIAACAATAAAFKDTSPFFLFSTAGLPSNVAAPQKSQLQSRQQVVDSTKGFLSSCPTNTYLIVDQAEVSSQDFSASKAAGGLRKAITRNNIKHSVSISEVVNGIDSAELSAYLEKICGAKLWDGQHSIKDQASIIYRQLPVPSHDSAEKRRDILASNDASVQEIITSFHGEYTVIYTTTPSSSLTPAAHVSPYEPEFQQPLHMEMKRQSGFAASNSTIPKNAPLFEKYQFFTPGLFMGIVVALLLLSILSVAINAVSSLKVSYGAFDKEMGPAAQRKTQ